MLNMPSSIYVGFSTAGFVGLICPNIYVGLIYPLICVGFFYSRFLFVGLIMPSNIHVGLICPLIYMSV